MQVPPLIRIVDMKISSILPARLYAAEQMRRTGYYSTMPSYVMSTYYTLDTETDTRPRQLTVRSELGPSIIDSLLYVKLIFQLCLSVLSRECVDHRIGFVNCVDTVVAQC